MARRTSSMRDVAPVEVSLWTTHTALISPLWSLRSRASIALASAPPRQSDAINSGIKPRVSAMAFHKLAKWPVSYISTLSPGESVLTRHASHAPVPEAGYKKTGPAVLKIVLMPLSTRWPNS